MKFQPILGANMTGRQGGIVASHNTYGPYFRVYARPVNRNTSGQQLQRTAFAIISQSWRGLSKPEQIAWTVAAPQHTVPNPTGGSQVLTGQALFMRINTLRQRIGLPILNSAPATDDVPSITLPTVVLDLDGSLTVTFDIGDEWNAPGGGIIMSASPMLSNGVQFNSYYTDVATFADPLNNPQAASLPYNTLAGGRIQFRYRATTPDGRLSALTYQDIIAPQQAIITRFEVTSATTAEVEFNRDIDATEFNAGDFTGAWQTTVTSVAQGLPNQLNLAGTVFASGAAYTLTPAGLAAAYTPVQSGVTT